MQNVRILYAFFWRQCARHFGFWTGLECERCPGKWHRNGTVLAQPSGSGERGMHRARRSSPLRDAARWGHRAMRSPAERRPYLHRIFDLRFLILDSYQRRAEGCADAKMSHMVLEGTGREADLKQSDGSSKRNDCFKIFFDE